MRDFSRRQMVRKASGRASTANAASIRGRGASRRRSQSAALRRRGDTVPTETATTQKQQVGHEFIPIHTPKTETKRTEVDRRIERGLIVENCTIVWMLDVEVGCFGGVRFLF